MNIRLEQIVLREGSLMPGPDGLDAWWAHVPKLHRALANPEGGELMPAFPAPDAGLEDVIAYWFPAYYLLVQQLGWMRPDWGLKRWFDTGRATDAPELALLSSAWDDRGQLDLLAAWAWTYGDKTTGMPRHALGLPDVPAPRVDPGSSWWATFNARWSQESSGLQLDPFHGGGSNLHLERHLICGLDGKAGSEPLLRTNREQRRAVLIVSKLIDWPAELYRRTGDLPDPGKRSWHVDVFCRQFGWLGTYRRSRETGLWFSGRHSVHMLGNNPG